MDSTNNLKELYEDKDGLRKEEVAALSGPNEFAEFYTRLKGIKDFYRRLPNEVSSLDILRGVDPVKYIFAADST
jgi:splicing factor 3A subunit 3